MEDRVFFKMKPFSTSNPKQAIDFVVSDLIRYLETTSTSPEMIGLALRLRQRLAQLRRLNYWTRMKRLDPTGYPAGDGDPFKERSPFARRPDEPKKVQ